MRASRRPASQPASQPGRGGRDSTFRSCATASTSQTDGHLSQHRPPSLGRCVIGLLHERVTVSVRPPGWRSGHDQFVFDGGSTARERPVDGVGGRSSRSRPRSRSAARRGCSRCGGRGRSSATARRRTPRRTSLAAVAWESRSAMPRFVCTPTRLVARWRCPGCRVWSPRPHWMPCLVKHARYRARCRARGASDADSTIRSKTS